jgi:4-hydroxybenzoate polyprenyltransferase
MSHASALGRRHRLMICLFKRSVPAIERFKMNNPEKHAGDTRVADASQDNWVDRYAPLAMRPYLKLMRADRPVGTWLLLWPCFWSITLAAPLGDGLIGLRHLYLPELGTLLLFAIGSFVMRGAGCTINDILDHKYDAQVARTRSRPIPSGAVSIKQAWLFLIALCLTGLVVLLQFNWFTVALGASSLILVGLYPLAKRITYWPQAVLGLTFNWGALLGWTAITGSLSLPPVLLYLGCICWTIGYDTIYAHQDKDDDAPLGLKSTALKFGDQTKYWLIGFYSTAIALFACAGVSAGIGWIYFLGLSIGGWHLMRQISRTRVDDPARCLAVFKSNRDFGAILFASFLAGTLGSGLS